MLCLRFVFMLVSRVLVAQRPLTDNAVDLDHFLVLRPDQTGGILHEYHIAT